MISKKRIEAYLYFLLRNRMAVTVVIAVMTSSSRTRPRR